MTALQTGAAILLLPASLCLTCCSGASYAPLQPQDDCGSRIAVAMNESGGTMVSSGPRMMDLGSGSFPAPNTGLALRCW